MTFAVVLDIIAAITMTVHVLMLRYKIPAGWAVGCVGNSCYLTLGIILGLPGLVSMEILFFCLCYSNYRKWKKDEKSLNSEKKETTP